jgi:hypothetical protein
MLVASGAIIIASKAYNNDTSKSIRDRMYIGVPVDFITLTRK